jgi:Na+-driven multidrug efflux pump
MSNVVLSKPKLGFIIATRAALGVGVGLLVSSRLGRRRRRKLGQTLVAVGALTTIPAAMLVTRSGRRSRRG